MAHAASNSRVFRQLIMVNQIERPMQAHRIDAKVAGDGSVTVRGLPFRAGEDVEVIILPRHSSSEEKHDCQPLQGSVQRYEQPFKSAADANDWEAM